MTARCERPEDICKSNQTFAENCCVLNYFDWRSPGIGRNMVYQMVMGFVFFALLFLIEFEVPQSIFCRSTLYKRGIGKKRSKKLKHQQDLDMDVWEEKTRIDRMGINQINSLNLVLKCMTKYYGTFLAVDNLSLAVGQ